MLRIKEIEYYGMWYVSDLPSRPNVAQGHFIAGTKHESRLMHGKLKMAFSAFLE